MLLSRTYDMSYDFRQRTASRDTILSLIIDGALSGRNVRSLVDAYVDDLIEDWQDDENKEFTPDSYKDIGVEETSNEIEKSMSDAFVARYRKRFNHPVSRETALEVFVYPLQGFPDRRVPKVVAVKVAEALADRDAHEANTMRNEMMRRQRP